MPFRNLLLAVAAGVLALTACQREPRHTDPATTPGPVAALTHPAAPEPPAAPATLAPVLVEVPPIPLPGPKRHKRRPQPPIPRMPPHVVG